MEAILCWATSTQWQLQVRRKCSVCCPQSTWTDLWIRSCKGQGRLGNSRIHNEHNVLFRWPLYSSMNVRYWLVHLEGEEGQSISQWDSAYTFVHSRIFTKLHEICPSRPLPILPLQREQKDWHGCSSFCQGKDFQEALESSQRASAFLGPPLDDVTWLRFPLLKAASVLISSQIVLE